MQDENYLSDHEATKVHGKLKGKHIRHSLNILNIENAFASRSPLFWQTTVDEKHMRAAELVGAHCETSVSHSLRLRNALSATSQT